MDEARRLAGLGAEDGTLVWALEQTAGRGRHGRGWSSPPGNLYCSMVLRPDCSPARAAQLSLVAAVALADAVASLVPPAATVRLKWPNDLLLDDRKTAGLLLEAASHADGGLDHLILGLGLNIASHPADVGQPVTDLGQAGATADAADALEAVMGRLFAWIARWEAGDFAAVRTAWLARAKGFGDTVTVRLGDERLSGRFAGLDAGGAMILETAAGRRAISAGEVFFSQPAG